MASRTADEIRDATDALKAAQQGVISVGAWTGPGPKVVQLPREGLRVDPVPLKLGRGFGDKFKCTVFGADLHVFRVDEGHVGMGWGEPMQFQWFDKSCFHGTVKVGPFAGPGSANVPLPSSGLFVDPLPLNHQGDGWPDAFECRVIGSRVEVWRTDAPSCGWGQDLELRYCLITAEARAALDADGDGQISLAEFASVDTDGDGILSADEIARANKGAVAAAAQDGDKAATTIQAHFRGYLSRKKLPW